MAFSKADQFPKDLFHQSFWSKNLSHPARIVILLHLIEKGEAPFHELKQGICLADSTIARHIQYLRTSGLVTVHQKHPYALYDLNDQTYSSLIREMKKVHGRFIPKRLKEKSAA